MVTKDAKASTVQGKRLQAETIATTVLAIGSEAIDFTNDFVAGSFVVFAMLCYRQSERKPAKAPLGHDRFKRNRSWSLCLCFSHDFSQKVCNFLGSCSRGLFDRAESRCR